MSRTRPLLVSLLSLGALIIGAPHSSRAEGTPLADGDTLRVVFTAETHANLEPCACTKEPWGGLARRVSFIRSLAAQGPTLRLDAGGLLPIDELPLRDDRGAAEHLARVLLRSLARSGYDVVLLEPSERVTLLQMATFEAEVLDRCALLPGPGHLRLFDWSGTRVVIATVPERATEAELRRVAAAARLRTSVPPAGDSSRSTPSCLIVLARADALAGKRIARVMTPDLLILSRGARPPHGLREGPAFLVGAGREGREVGVVSLVREENPTRDGTRFRIVGHTLTPMDDRIAEDPSTAAEVARLLREDGVSVRAYVSRSE